MDGTNNDQNKNKSPQIIIWGDFYLFFIFNNLAVIAMIIKHGAAHSCATEPLNFSEAP